jgi:hypothetical protein
MTRNKIFKEAVKLGAVSYCDYIIKYCAVNQLFSTHFFNANGWEIAYYITDFEKYGLTVLPEPRLWSSKFIELPCYKFSKIKK